MSTPQPHARYSTEKAVRLEARLSPSQKRLIQRAADLQGRSLTDFVLNCSQTTAQKIIREHEILSLTAKESAEFANALINEIKPNTALRNASKRHKTLIKK